MLVPTRLLAPAVLAVAVAVAGCSSPGADDDPGRSAPPGEVFPAVLTDDIVGDVVTFVLPARVYEVEVGRPQRTVDSLSADEAGLSAAATDGVAFVAVAWQLGHGRGDAIALGYGGPDVSPQLSLTAGDETYEVGALDQEGASASWVAVPADATPIGVEVEFDGVTQAVEDTTDRHAEPEGGSDLLHADEPPGLHAPECPEPAEGPEPARYVVGSCLVQVTDPFPYHEQLGWADDGRAWVVARLAVEPVVVGWDEPGSGGAVVDYETTPEDLEVTLDGAGPMDVVAREPDQPAGLQDDGRWSGDAIFSVPADARSYELAFARPYTGLPADADEARAEGAPVELAGTYAATFAVDVG